MNTKTVQPNNGQDKREPTDTGREAFKSRLDALEQFILSNRKDN